MITSVTVTNHLGESIVLDLRSPEKSGLQVLNIDGLGPVKANINVTDNITTDGSTFNSSRQGARNILFRFKLLETPTIQDTRRALYQFFPNKKKIDLLIDSGDRIDYVSGYVEDNDINFFGKDEQKALISIICPNPYLYSLNIQTTLFSGVNSLFEFPFSNESLVSKLLIFGEIENTDEKNIYYSGDKETGITIYMNALGAITDPVFYNSRTSQLIKISSSKLFALLGFTIVQGDHIRITSVVGQKSITFVRDGLYYNILNALDSNSSWPFL